MKPAHAVNGWRVSVLASFPEASAGAGVVTAVADPDRLLTDPTIVETLRARGFEILTCDDPVAFRIQYERRFRASWDRDGRAPTGLVARTGSAETDALPHDVVVRARRDGRYLTLSRAHLFPNLDPRIVAELSVTDLDALHAAVLRVTPDPLGETGTKDFVLRHVFGVEPTLIRQPHDLLRELLRRHFTPRATPRSVERRVVDLLRKDEQWADWPLEMLVPDRGVFFAFLQERWPLYVRRHRRADAVHEDEGAYGLRVPGPAHLDFGHPEVRVYVDSLFLDGHLAPVEIDGPLPVADAWMTVGTTSPSAQPAADRLERLLGRVRDGLPGEQPRHEQWQSLAPIWGELVAQRWAPHVHASEQVLQDIEEVRGVIDRGFETWVVAHHASLHGLSSWPRPVMVHQVPDFARDRLDGATKKIAVVVVDGLALDQWAILRDSLAERGTADLEIDQAAIFAWVPTLTSVSRQSIFAALPPVYFGDSLDTTSREESRWRRYWSDHGLSGRQVGYACHGLQEDATTLRERVAVIADHPDCKVLGLVLGTVDQAMHGNPLAMGGLHAAVRQWADSGEFRAMLCLLLDGGFEIVLTADHGNVEARGIGKPNVGVTADERGERVHVFRDKPTRNRIASEYAGTISWPDGSLPDDYLPLFAPPGGAFVPESRRLVCHGGLAMEEVLVPFAHIRRPQ